MEYVCMTLVMEVVK